jgi:DNA polymerase family B
MPLLQNELGLEVIYGDTDSVMVNTRTKDLAQAKEQVHILSCQHVSIHLVFSKRLYKVNARLLHTHHTASCCCMEFLQLWHAPVITPLRVYSVREVERYCQSL